MHAYRHGTSSGNAGDPSQRRHTHGVELGGLHQQAETACASMESVAADWMGRLYVELGNDDMVCALQVCVVAGVVQGWHD